MRTVELCRKLNKICMYFFEHLPVIKALLGADPEKKAGPIHAFNPEHLPVFKAQCGDNPEQNVGTIHVSNAKHILVFKALSGDVLEQNGLQSTSPNRNTSSNYATHTDIATL